MNRAAHVLIVDDEPNVRLMFRTSLSSEGYTLSVAEDGESALKAQETSPSDLILLDLQMPGIDGLATLRRLRDRGDDVAVVFITAHGSVPHAVEAMKLGAIDFLPKPITPEALRQIVASVLHRQQANVPASHSNEPITPPIQAGINLNRAKRAINMRHFDEAEVFLKQALALVSHSAETHNLMGVLHEMKGEHDASYRSYRAALKVDRHYEPAKHNMQRYYERFTFGRSDVPIDTGV